MLYDLLSLLTAANNIENNIYFITKTPSMPTVLLSEMSNFLDVIQFFEEQASLRQRNRLLIVHKAVEFEHSVNVLINDYNNGKVFIYDTTKDDCDNFEIGCAFILCILTTLTINEILKMVLE